MKTYLPRILMAVFALGLCAEVLAEVKSDYPRISISGPGGSKVKFERSQLVMLVVDGPNLSAEGIAIPSADAVNYVNKLLETKKVSYIGVYAREGTKYGDVVAALDLLRETTAKDIGLSTKVLPYGKEP